MGTMSGRSCLEGLGREQKGLLQGFMGRPQSQRPLLIASTPARRAGAVSNAHLVSGGVPGGLGA